MRRNKKILSVQKETSMGTIITNDTNCKRSKTEDNTIRQNSIDNSKFTLSRNQRWWVFGVISSLFLTSFDQGTLSSSTGDLSRDFGLDTLELGGLGGSIFFGISAGCLCTFYLINKFRRKLMLLITIIINLISILLVTLTRNILLLYICRTVTGFSTAFLSIYGPVWSDQFGVHKFKSLLLSLINIFSAVGFLIGYTLGFLIGWKNAFYLQTLLILVQFFLVFFTIPESYFSSSIVPLKSKENIESIDNHIINNDDASCKSNTSYFEDIEKTENRNLKDESIITHIKILFSSYNFIIVNLCLVCLFIIVSAVQFWINDYLENCLNITEGHSRLFSVSFVLITAPMAGITAGGLAAGKAGGYENKKVLYITAISTALTLFIGNLLPMPDNIIPFAIIFWFFLFFGSIVLPIANGLVLCSVPKEYSGLASGASCFIYNILGRLPGPNVYALLKEITSKESRIPLWVILNFALIALILQILLILLNKRKKYKELVEDNYNENESEIDEKKKNINNNIINTINTNNTNNSINNIE